MIVKNVLTKSSIVYIFYILDKDLVWWFQLILEYLLWCYIWGFLTFFALQNQILISKLYNRNQRLNRFLIKDNWLNLCMHVGNSKMILLLE